MDLREAKDIKKRWQEYTELYKKDLHDPDNHDGVISHLNQTSQNVKLRTPKEVEEMESKLSYFKSSKKCCESAALHMSANLEN